MLPNSNFNANVLPVIAPAAIVDNAAFTSNVINLASDAVAGAKFLAFAVQLGAIDAGLAVFRVQESDTLTNATTLGGAAADVLDVTESVTPGASDDNKVYLVTVDLRAPRKQFLQLQVTAGDGGAGTYLSALAFPVLPHAIASNNNAAAHVTG